MVRQIVRVQLKPPEYDVVFEDGVPIYVGAVIPRPASVSGPDAGKIVDTHRTTWDARGHHLGHYSLAQQAVTAAKRKLAQGDRSALRTRVPAAVERPYKEIIIGTPHPSTSAAIHRRRNAARVSNSRA